MLVTEEEARTKWCPETRSGIFSGEQTLCIASKCMAWRLYSGPTPAQYEECTTKGGLPTHGSDWEMVSHDDGSAFHKLTFRRLTKEAQPARGFCGIAGSLYRFD